MPMLQRRTLCHREAEGLAQGLAGPKWLSGSSNPGRRHPLSCGNVKGQVLSPSASFPRK